MNEIQKPQRSQRLVFKRKRSFTYSTAIAYLSSKTEIDDEWRRMVEAILETLVNREGIAGHPIEGLEIVEGEE